MSEQEQKSSEPPSEKSTEPTTGSGWAGDKDPRYRDLPEIGEFEKKQKKQKEEEEKKKKK